MIKYLSIFCLILISTSCQQQKEVEHLKNGSWLFQLYLDDENKSVVLPFNAEVESDNIVFSNDKEKIETQIHYVNDSVIITMPVFGSEFIGHIKENTFIGYWNNYNKQDNYKIPFTATFNEKDRFIVSSVNYSDVSGKWMVYFYSAGNDSTKAIAQFKQSGNILTGTFFTEVGDYRFLEGVIDDRHLKLSTFDGAHAFLFEADLNDEGNLQGTFRSGNSWKENWFAIKNESARLRGMKDLTYLKDGYEKLSFSFPDVNGNILSLADDKYKDKVMIVQIFGTWCPNCMDETRYLVELYYNYHEQGLEIIGLDFEPKPTMEYFRSREQRFRKDLNVPYDIVLAGHANKKKAAQSLPMLNHIMSYPTAIIINRKGDIVEIHTGFSGPGTGQAYLDYKAEMESLIEELIAL